MAFSPLSISFFVFKADVEETAVAVITHHRKLSQQYSSNTTEGLSALVDVVDAEIDDDDNDDNDGDEAEAEVVSPVYRSEAEATAAAAVANAKFKEEMAKKKGRGKTYLAHLWAIDNMPRLFSPAHLAKTSSTSLFHLRFIIL